MPTRKEKLIPKEILFSIISRLGDNSTWTNIFNHTLNERGKRFAPNDISFSLKYYLKENLLIEKEKNRKSNIYILAKSTDTYDDFLRNVANKKKSELKQLVDVLDNKQIFTKDGGFAVKNHEDFTKFMIALEDSFEFYNTLLHTRENADYDGDSMTGLADTQAHDIFNSHITYIIRLTRKSIDECCTQLKDGREQEELIKINGMLDNITWSFKV